MPDKIGGLIYQKDYGDGIKKQSTNDLLILAGTFQYFIMVTISVECMPFPAEFPLLRTALGFRYWKEVKVRTKFLDQFSIYCKQTLTGVKFLLTVDPGTAVSVIEAVQKRVYEIYADYALKNPFYIMDNPIVRCEPFDRALSTLFAEASTVGVRK